MSDIFKKVAAVVIGFLILGAITGTWKHLLDFWVAQASVSANRLTIEEIESEAQEVLKAQQQILKGLEEIKGIILTPEVTGRATVSRSGSDELFIEINRRGDAQVYLKQRKARITYMDAEGIEHSVTLPIKGDFINNDAGHLLIFSKRAGDSMGLHGIIRGVTIGPATK
jgi:hypothetical protein